MEYTQRKHARYEWHDYNGGMYFITICVKDRKHLFGAIKDNSINYTEIGRVAVQHLEKIPSHWSHVKVISSVVMPNHVHMIISIDGESIDKDPSNTLTPERSSKLGGLHSILASIIGGYKAGVKRYANSHGIEFCWQSGFHDHIIRDTDNFDIISWYIANNIYKWPDDCYYG